MLFTTNLPLRSLVVPKPERQQRQFCRRCAGAALLCGVACLWAAAAQAQSAPPALDAYNVVWTAPSKDAAGSMPIGNGEVGLNVWIEENGDLLFYIARTDSWSECNRLLKLGRVRVSLTPNPFAKGQPFRQELKLRDGQIVVNAADMTLRLFVDADAPVIHIVGEGATPRTVTAKLEVWRTAKHVLKGDELQSSWTMLRAPDAIEVWESPDIVGGGAPNTVTWRHRNAYSVVPLTLKHQGLESLTPLVKDILANRTFGGQIAGPGFASAGADTIKAEKPATKFALAVTTHTAQTDTLVAWDQELQKVAQEADDGQTAAQKTAAWWNAFWNRSWIFATEGQGTATSPTAQKTQEKKDAVSEPTRVSQAYILQRWITACAGRGHYPIKFNGSIFTVDPKYAGGPDFSPDWRRWGDAYWWQNTRLPYFPMVARGDWDELQPLFQFYQNALPLCVARAKLYHNVGGAYFPETMTNFGTYGNGDYGWDRKGHQPNEILCPWWQYAWQQGLELVALMLDAYDCSQDREFLAKDVIPMAHEVLRYYDTRFARDAHGKLVISPTQSVETYWYDVVNDTPSVAGLHDVVDRLLALPADIAPPGEHAFWLKMKAAAPALPLMSENGKTRVSPAERFKPKRSNCENPELYTIWPFRLFGVGRDKLEVGVETFLRRTEKASIGWQYDGQSAAILGLADEAQKIILGKVANSNAKFRFPAMWGPNYDWLPDQDHGSNVMLTVQHMLLETTGDKIFVLPAWPQAWNVSFKLYAPRRTVIECDYRDGKLQRLAVTPPERRKDVCLPAWLKERTP